MFSLYAPYLSHVRYLSAQGLNYLASPSRDLTHKRVVAVRDKYLTYVIDGVLEVKFRHKRLDAQMPVEALTIYSQSIVITVR